MIDGLLKTIPQQHPTHLNDFQYTFSSDGKLVNSETNGKFAFVTQTHYDALGDLVAPYIQDLMTKRFGLIEVHLPLDAEADQPTNNVFKSPDADTCEQLMVCTFILF